MHFPPRPRGRGHLAQPIAARAALGSAPLPAAVPNQSAAGEWAGRAGGARPDGRTGGGPAQVPLAPRCPFGSRSPRPSPWRPPSRGSAPPTTECSTASSSCCRRGSGPSITTQRVTGGGHLGSRWGGGEGGAGDVLPTGGGRHRDRSNAV